MDGASFHRRTKRAVSVGPTGRTFISSVTSDSASTFTPPQCDCCFFHPVGFPAKDHVNGP